MKQAVLYVIHKKEQGWKNLSSTQCPWDCSINPLMTLRLQACVGGACVSDLHHYCHTSHLLSAILCLNCVVRFVPSTMGVTPHDACIWLPCRAEPKGPAPLAQDLNHGKQSFSATQWQNLPKGSLALPTDQLGPLRGMSKHSSFVRTLSNIPDYFKSNTSYKY